MNSTPRNETTGPPRGAALAGALFGAIEARWALPAVENPLLSFAEWWGCWFTAVVLGATTGLIVGLVLRALFRGRATEAASRLAIGVAVAVPLFASLFLRLRPHFGPEGRTLTLVLAGAGAFLLLGYVLLLPARRRMRWLLAPGIVLALLATLSGLLLLPGDAPPTEEGETSPPSLLLITLDTVRADHLPPDAGFFEAEGFLQELHGTGVRFTQLGAPVPLTGPSHASLLSGLPPREHGAQDNGWQIGAGVETLAEGLRRNGYATGAVISAAVLHRDLCGLDRGFEEYDDSFRAADPLRRIVFVAVAERLADRGSGRARGWSHQRRARETVEIAKRFLRRHRDEPFFLWLHFYDAHAPYEPLGPPLERDRLPALEGEPEDEVSYWEARGNYAAELRDLDEALSELGRELETAGLLSSTLLVLVTDHGESFGTHGRNYRFDHGAYLYDDELRLSAWWREPGAPGGATIPQSHAIDALGRALHARMLEGAQGPGEALPPSPGYALAHSTVAGDTLWFSLRRPDRKLLLGQDPRGGLVFEAYDLAQDPQEQRQLLERRRPPSRSPADTLGSSPRADWVADEDRLLEYADEVQRTLSRERPELSEDARERLRSLGYIR